MLAVVSMSGEAPKKKVTLGPGLFDPEIQTTPDSNFGTSDAKKPATRQVLVGRSQIEALFDAADSDSDGKINLEEVEQLVVSLGNNPSPVAMIRIFRQLNSEGNGLVR